MVLGGVERERQQIEQVKVVALEFRALCRPAGTAERRVRAPNGGPRPQEKRPDPAGFEAWVEIFRIFL